MSRPDTITLHDRRFRIYIPQKEIEQRVAALGEKIRSDYNDKKIVYVIVLKGAMMFAMDLIRQAAVSCEIDVVSAASYGNEMVSSGNVSIRLPSSPVALHDKDVIIVEDIVDTGRTIARLRHSPRSIRTASLLFKSGVYAETFPIEYVGFDIEPAFVVGYGMDYAEAGRHLPDVYILHEEE